MKNWVQVRTEKIESGTFTQDDVRLLFIDLRDCIAENELLREKVLNLYDIFDSCAHPSQRSRGAIFRHSRKIVHEFIQSVKSGGSVSNDVNIDINASLKIIYAELGIRYNDVRFTEQIPRITECIYALLGGSKLIIEDEAIEYCEIVHNDILNQVFIAFKLKPFSYTHSSGLTISGEPIMNFILM